VPDPMSVRRAPMRPDAATPARGLAASRQSLPRSATRIPQLLCLLAGQPAGATLSQLSERSGTPKSSLLALLRALTQSGFLQHRDGRYAIGPEAVKLASAIVSQRKFPDIAVPIVDALAVTTGESALLAQLDAEAASAVYIYKSESRSPLRFIVEVGSREPLYPSAIGRVLLAFQPTGWRASYLRCTKLVPLTPKTNKSKRNLRRLLEAVRRNRLATSYEETIEGVVGIAAPIFDKDGDALAGLVIGVPMARALPRMEVLETQVGEAAAEISRLMGYAGTWRVGEKADDRYRQRR
jgi:DNA-binding IclR family transcriptional regulator